MANSVADRRNRGTDNVDSVHVFGVHPYEFDVCQNVVQHETVFVASLPLSVLIVATPSHVVDASGDVGARIGLVVWTPFAEHPAKFSYEALERVPVPRLLVFRLEYAVLEVEMHLFARDFFQYLHRLV